MFKKKTLTVAVQAAILISAAAVMQGCVLSDESSKTVNGPLSTQVNAPKGTVSGLVIDTNGNPVVGAKVYLGAKTTKTNAGGMYSFSNVPVVDTVSLGGVASPALVVNIVAEGYLGATVTVMPEAQIDGMANADNTGGSVNNQVTTFVSGYTAQAGTAVLPALTTSITGTLRSSATGETLGGVEVALDMQTVNAAQTAGVGTSTSYATPSYTATTAADGSFTLANVPADSNVRFVVGGYTVDAVSAYAAGAVVTTNDEVAVIDVSDVMVTAITGGDTVNPYVVGMSNIAANNMFNDTVDGTTGIDVMFSEALAANADGVYEVLVHTAAGYVALAAPATLSADGKTLSFATATAIPAGTAVDISILNVDLNDMSGNIAVNGTAVAYDSIVAAANGNNYLRLSMTTWSDANTNAGAITNEMQHQTDDTGTDDFAAIQAMTPAFNDVYDGTLFGFNFSQLNGDALAAPRLAALATAINGGAGVTVEGDVARVSFTPSNASYYVYTGDATPADIAFASANVLAGPAGANSFVVSDANDVVFVINNAAPGDVLTVTPYDDLGYAGTPVSLTLADNVEPTTVVQRSYGIAPKVEAPATVADYGQGGELSQIGSTVLYGTPYLNITMQLLDNNNSAGDTLNEELVANNTVNTATGTAYITTANVYDATAYAAMATDLSRTVGVSFSENVTLTGTPTDTVTTALSGWAEHNDTTVDDGSIDGLIGTQTVDLVDVDVANVMALANADHDAVIDFSNVIADASGNVGTVAKVVVRDMMPPMVTNAVYNGDNLTITFNEAVAPVVGDTLSLFGAGAGSTVATLTQATVDAFNAQTDKTVLVVPHTDWGGDINWSIRMNLANYDEGAVLDAMHGGVDASSINDVHGNDSSTFTGRAGVTKVSFAYYNALDVMAMSAPVAPAFAAAATTFTVTYTSNHDIDLVASFGAASTTALTGAEVVTNFALTSAATIDPLTSSAVLSANGRSLIVTVGVTGAIATGDTFASNSNFVSDYDGAQSAAAALITAP